MIEALSLVCCCCLVAKLCPTLVIPRTVASQAPLSMGLPGQEYWSVGCHFLLQRVKVKLLICVWLSLQGSSAHGIFQARVLECVAIVFSEGDIRINIKSSKGGGHSLEKSIMGSKISVEARDRSIPVWLEWNWEEKVLGGELGKTRWTRKVQLGWTRKVQVGQAFWALLRTGFYSEWGSLGGLDGKESACNAGCCCCC